MRHRRVRRLPPQRKQPRQSSGLSGPLEEATALGRQDRAESGGDPGWGVRPPGWDSAGLVPGLHVPGPALTSLVRACPPPASLLEVQQGGQGGRGWRRWRWWEAEPSPGAGLLPSSGPSWPSGFLHPAQWVTRSAPLKHDQVSEGKGRPSPSTGQVRISSRREASLWACFPQPRHLDKRWAPQGSCNKLTSSNLGRGPWHCRGNRGVAVECHQTLSSCAPGAMCRPTSYKGPVAAGLTPLMLTRAGPGRAESVRTSGTALSQHSMGTGAL